MIIKIIGALCLAAGIYFIFMPLSFNNSGVEVSGKVLAVNNRSVYSISDNKYHQKTDITVSYTTPDGKATQFETTTLPLFTSFSVGQTVPVMYNPTTTMASIKDPNSKWYFPAFLILFGLIALFAKRASVVTSSAQ